MTGESVMEEERRGQGGEAKKWKGEIEERQRSGKEA